MDNHIKDDKIINEKEAKKLEKKTEQSHAILGWNS